jgi:2-polyprenyl-6-methoxyphenol hydroxylase-like FAD-dependent oxidoreductase
MEIAISDAGIAVLATAIYLKSSNHKVTVFEKSDGFKSQGYGVSIKSFGIHILQSLAVLDKLKCKGLSISAFNIYNTRGRLIWSIPKNIIRQMTGGAFPVSRAHLHEVLFKLIDQPVPVVFNKWIIAINHLPETERITFNDGSSKEFDLVTIAEGLRSSSRQLLCGNEGWNPGDIKCRRTYPFQKRDNE